MTELNPDDAVLIARIAKSHTDALDQLYDRYKHLVFSVALAIVGDRATAEEITLDVFVITLVIAISVAFCAILFNTLKAARSNPVNSLRNES